MSEEIKGWLTWLIRQWNTFSDFIKTHALTILIAFNIASLVGVVWYVDILSIFCTDVQPVEDIKKSNTAIVWLLTLLIVDIVAALYHSLRKIKPDFYTALTSIKSTEDHITDIKRDTGNGLKALRKNSTGILTLSQEARTFLEEIKSDSNSILNSISILNPDALPFDDDILAAKKCIFVSGTNMRFMGKVRQKFVDAASDVEIIFAISKVDDPNVKLWLNYFSEKTDEELQKYKTRFRYDVAYINEERKKLGKTEVRIIELDFFLPIAYFAIDYRDEEQGFSVIHAKHYLLSDKGEERTRAFNLSVHPRTKLYDKYREQIRLIEHYGDDLSKRFTVAKSEEKKPHEKH